jgi:hypothetical protein
MGIHFWGLSRLEALIVMTPIQIGDGVKRRRVTGCWQICRITALIVICKLLKNKRIIKQ